MLVPVDSLAAYERSLDSADDLFEFTAQSSIGRAGRPPGWGLNLPILLILLASLAAGTVLVVRGSRMEAPAWWTNRVAAFEASSAEGALAPADSGTASSEVTAPGQAAESPPSPPAPAAPLPIGGWLILPGIGLVLSPPNILSKSDSLLRILDRAVWVEALESAGAWRGMMEFTLLFELCGNTLLVAVAVWANVEFFRRRRVFPLVYILFMVLGIVLQFSDSLLATMVGPASSPVTPQEVGRLSVSIAGFVIWTTYLLRSGRARRTFVR